MTIQNFLYSYVCLLYYGLLNKLYFLYGELLNCIAPVMQFTDDSAMTRSLAESLIERKSLDVVDIARRFVKSYYQEPNRGYGASVVTVSTLLFKLYTVKK